MIGDVFTWLNDPAHWRGTFAMTGIVDQLLAHIKFSLIAMVLAVAIALPLGLLIGHTGRGTWMVTGANAMRSLPSVGILVLLVIIVSPHFQGRTDAGFLVPTEIVLVVLAIPPILSNTFAGVQSISPDARDAAMGMGMTEWQVLRGVELPCSLPLIFSGVRSAALQVIATATIASYVTLGGLGRFIYDGLAQQDFPQMVSGGVLVAALALATELLLALLQRYAVPRGISGRFAKARTPPAVQDPRETQVLRATSLTS